MAILVSFFATLVVSNQEFSENRELSFLRGKVKYRRMLGDFCILIL